MECPKCRSVSLPGSHFCEKCGYDLKALQRQQPRSVNPYNEAPYRSGEGGSIYGQPSRGSEYSSYRPAPAPAPSPAPAPRPGQASPPPPRPVASNPVARTPAPPPSRPVSNPIRSQPRAAAPTPAAPAKPPQPPAYAVLEEASSGQRIELRWDRSAVGRQNPSENIFPEVDLEGLDRDGSISRRHALILRDGNSVVVEDCASRNGTFVNQTKVEAGLQHELKEGDELRFGTVRFRFRRNP